VGNAKDRPGGLDELENRSGLWEGLAEGGGRRGKEPKWKMGRGGGLYGVYNTPMHYARGPH